MGDFNRKEKICGFYVSSVHLITMILPYIKKQIKKDVKIETILEYNLQDIVNNFLNNLIINDKEKNDILSINWSNNKIQKYLSIEKKLKNIIENNKEIILLVSGSKKYIEDMNKMIDKFINRNINKINEKKITIIDCYEVTEFDDNIRDILDEHEFIINTSGIHEIGDIFEDYKNKKVN